MYRTYVKRFLDIVFAIIGMPFFIIIFIVVSPLIFLEDKGPIFYNAQRIGRNGTVFTMYKFRSMKKNAPDLRNKDGTTFNSENDSRVTRIGKILRRTSLDETPQLLNVLIGDMSFIGPRQDLPDMIKIYREGDERKLLIRPGITGYSQVMYRNSSSLDQRFDGDIYYEANISMLLDLKIILKTIEVVIKHRNIYRNSEGGIQE